MTPRNKLGSSAYAFNADTIDGIDGSSLARNDAANTYSAANVFNITVTVGSSNSATKFVVQDNSSVALLTADTSATIVKVGTTSTATLSNVRLLSTSAEFTGTVRIGTSTNGIDMSGASGLLLTGTARPTRTVSLIPEYPGATFEGDGSNNLGSLSSDFCSGSARLNLNATVCGGTTSEYNYYEWTNPNAAVQDYDLYIRYKIPADYDTGSMTNLTLERWGSVVTTDKVHISMYGSAAATLCSSNTANIATNATWQTITIAAPLGTCSITAGDTITLKVHLEAAQNNAARAGEITLKYRSKF
jgi:hypothetical protein